MESKQKTGWGSPSDWGVAIGALIAVIGLLSIISGIWTPDAAKSAEVGFLGSSSMVPSVIILVIGVIILAVSMFLKRKA